MTDQEESKSGTADVTVNVEIDRSAIAPEGLAADGHAADDPAVDEAAANGHAANANAHENGKDLDLTNGESRTSSADKRRSMFQSLAVGKPVEISWKDVTFSVPGADGKPKELLHSLNGTIRPGSLCAIMYVREIEPVKKWRSTNVRLNAILIGVHQALESRRCSIFLQVVSRQVVASRSKVAFLPMAKLSTPSPFVKKSRT